MVEKFLGKWELVESENFEGYMQAVGMSLEIRKAFGNIKFNQEINKSGDIITVKTVTALKSTEESFKLGETFDEITGDGRKMRTTYSMQGDDLLAVQEPVKDSDVRTTLLRSLTADGMTLVLEAAGVTSVRKYKAA